MHSAQFQLHAQIEERHWWFVARRRILRELVAAVAPPEPSCHQTVVDIGCGTGANIAAFSSDYRCFGVDASAEAIELARSRFPEVNFHCGEAPGDITDWLGEVNVVLLTDVLEHVEDDRGMLEGIVEACSPATKLVITVPADMRLWSPHDTAFGHYRRYDMSSLASIWQGMPVQVRLLSHFNHRLYPAVRLARTISRLRGRSAGAADTDFRLPNPPTNRLLETIFAGESNHLSAAIDSDNCPYHRGVSLVAILQRR